MARGSGAADTVEIPSVLPRRTPTKSKWSFEGLTWARAGETPLPSKLSYPRNSLLVVGGLPGAGKTTLLEQIKTDALVISPEALAAEAGVKMNTEESVKLQKDKIASGLQDGRSVILDAPAIYGRLRRFYRRLAARAEAVPCLLFLDASPDVARQAQFLRQTNDGKQAMPEENWQPYLKEYESLIFDLEYMEEEDMDDRFEYRSITVADRETVGAVDEISFDA